MKIKYLLPVFSLVISAFLIYQMVGPDIHVSANDSNQNLSAQILSTSSTDSPSASIGGIEITETKKTAIQSLVAAEVEQWQNNDLIVEGTTATISIPGSNFTFDVDKTVDAFLALTKSPWYKFWESDKNIQVPMEVIVNENVEELLEEAPLFYVGDTLNSVIEHAQLLKKDPVVATEVALSKDDMKRISFEIEDVSVNGIGILSIVEALNDTTIVNDGQFSFLEKLKEVEGLYSEETANFVASLLYSTVLQSDLTILERHSQNVYPNYLEPGIEAKVNMARTQDFKFINQTETPFIVAASLKDGNLIVELYSFKSDYEVSYYVSNKEQVKPRTIYRLSANLPIGTERVLENGQDGLRIQVYRKTTDVKSSYEDDILISRDFYPPENRVVLVSSKEPVEVPTEDSLTIPVYDSEGNLIGVVPNEPETGTVDEVTESGTGTSNSTTGDSSNESNQDEEEKVVEYDKGGNIITSDTK